MIHCTGGGQTKILHFLDRRHVIKDNLFPVPPVFELIQKESATPWREMYGVFNMGHRLEIYTPPAKADALIAIAGKFGVEARVVGRVEGARRKKLTIESPHGRFTY
jgi:phosphoribosylformylglycinamidine cyclo-ligase